jgi:hypothetical protein
MKRIISKNLILTICVAAFGLTSSSALCFARSGLQEQKQSSQASNPPEHKKPEQQKTVAAFQDRIKEYVKFRERLEETMPKLSKEAKPEEIEVHKKSFQEMVRKARGNAKPGDIFTPDIIKHIRGTLKREFKGKDLKELRETVFEAETKGVPVRVNYPYPENKELMEMPPTVLLALPELPKQMRYRYVGSHLLLVDRENGLIIDYMLDALP